MDVTYRVMGTDEDGEEWIIEDKLTERQALDASRVARENYPESSIQVERIPARDKGEQR